VVAIRPAGDRGDDRAEQAEPDVRVLEALVDAADRAVRRQRPQAVGVRERVHELPVVGVGAVAQHAAAVAEQVGERAVADPGLGRPRQVPVEAVVEAQPSGLGQLDDGRRRERLRVRGDAEQVRRRERDLRGHVGMSVRDGQCEVGAAQNAPRFVKTAGRVLSRIDRSRNTDHRSR